MAQTTRIPVTGNTYPIKDQLKALGGRWDADRKAWMVPADKAAQAQALVAGAPKQASRATIGSASGRTYGRTSYRSSRSDTVRCRHCGKRTPEGDDWCMSCGRADYEY